MSTTYSLFLMVLLGRQSIWSWSITPRTVHPSYCHHHQLVLVSPSSAVVDEDIVVDVSSLFTFLYSWKISMTTKDTTDFVTQVERFWQESQTDKYSPNYYFLKYFFDQPISQIVIFVCVSMLRLLLNWQGKCVLRIASAIYSLLYFPIGSGKKRRRSVVILSSWMGSTH